MKYLLIILALLCVTPTAYAMGRNEKTIQCNKNGIGVWCSSLQARRQLPVKAFGENKCLPGVWCKKKREMENKAFSKITCRLFQLNCKTKQEDFDKNWLQTKYITGQKDNTDFM